ncbi:vicilin-like seed storage protein At2g18540 [Xiphophorus maculatus]|uniref:Vicilin-like seed storage protein At2g18540 n=1 Tax=Xiphophorus maculatus TaxID=8083 RepID=A0A3B5QAP1_XIPMA|nr:vicilin-like seed storage protein At2g18540 [Xiphophorus maculatus]
MASAEPVPDVVEPLKRCGSNDLLRPDMSEQKDEDEGLTMAVKRKPLNLVLFGPSEPLKTAAAKVILGHKDLPSECVRKQGEVFGRGVSLVVLPALYGKAEQEVMEESFRCVSLCDPEGVHAFILVLPVGPLTDEDKGELHTIQDTFSSRVNDFTIILFTTELDPEHPDVDKFIENKNIQDLLQICGGRYFVLNIRDRRQIKELMETVCGEKSSVFSTEMFTKVLIERILKVEAELKDVKQKSEDEQQSTKQLREETEELKKQEEELKKKHREETKSLQSQLEQQRKQQIQMLKEKVEIIENEREKRKKEREEEDRRWRKQEELQRKEWKQKLDASENRVKVEREQREAAERRLDQSRRDRTRDRDAWDKEKVGILERMHQDLKQNLQETKQNLEEERARNRKLQEDFYLKRRKWTYLGFTLLLSVTLVLLYVYQSH